MTQAYIKHECEVNYKKIKQANERLEELRKICQHPNTYKGLWSWRPGSIEPAIICSDCGKLIKTVHEYILPQTQTGTNQY